MKSAGVHSVIESERVSLPALVVNTSDRDFRNVPVSGGLCLPRGQLKDIGSLVAWCGDQPIVVQAEVLNRWSDGSVRWILASMIMPRLERSLIRAHNKSASTSTAEKQATAATTGSFAVPTPLRLETSAICPEANGPATSCRYAEGEIRLSIRQLTGDRPTENTLLIRPVLQNVAGSPFNIRIESVREEANGPVRQIVTADAHLEDHPAIRLQLRFTIWNSVGDSGRLIELQTRIRNSQRAKHEGGLWDLGDPGSFRFGSFGLQIGHVDQGSGSLISWRCEAGQPVQEFRGRGQLTIRQHGSGGPNWNSDNHLTAEEQLGVLNQGYDVSSPGGTNHGLRAEPLVRIAGDSGCLTVAVPEFWQQFPGSIAAGDGRITVGLFPDISPLQHELQAGEQKTRSVWISDDAHITDLSDLDWTLSPARMLQPPDAYEQAQVFPWFLADRTVDPSSGRPLRSSAHAEDSSLPDDPQRLSRYLRRALTGRFSLSSRRESIDEFGWRHYGDLPADHEQRHYQGPGTVVSHFNNQFDMIYGSILQMCAAGDAGWFDLFDPMARHVCDIDIYHTSEDRPAFNGGLFWHTDHYVNAHTATHRTYSARNVPPGGEYGGGPSCEHNYTTGLLHYYFLTGYREAYEAVLSLAEWVIRMDDGRGTILGILDDGPTGLASATVSEDFHGPGRGAGNSVNALLDAWLLTASDRFLLKAEELIRRCVHPRQSLYAMRLLDSEQRWSYTVFLNSLCRYLLIKLEAGQQDTMYSFARRVMSHYGRWMAASEVPALSRPDELKYPTEAWAAQEFRKANVLRLAALCEDDPRQAASMRSRARELNNAAWDDLLRFGEAGLNVRCLSIIMTEGQRDLFHRLSSTRMLPPGPANQDDSEWTMFVPQKQRVREMLTSPARLLKIAAGLLNPCRWQRFLRAVRHRRYSSPAGSRTAGATDRPSFNSGKRNS